MDPDSEGIQSSPFKIVRWFCKYKPLLKFLFIIGLPLVLMPMLFVSDSQEAKAAYVLLLVSIFWCTEILPLGITGLIPALLLPLLGIIPSNDVAKVYMKESIGMVTLSAFSVCVAIEKWNLHRRIALNVLLCVGFSPVRLVLGFMLTCMLLSMWISNTATTTIMIPVAEAVLQSIRHHLVDDEFEDLEKYQEDTIGYSAERSDKSKSTVTNPGDDKGRYVSLKKSKVEGKLTDEEFKNVCKVMCLSVAYGATIGGSATIIGTGAILASKAQIEIVFEPYGVDPGFTFFRWTAFALPACIICTFLAWVWLQIKWIGVRNTWHAWFGKHTEAEISTNKEIETLIRDERKKLGPISFAETAIAINFAIMVCLWFLEKPGLFKGWSALFPEGFVGTSIPPLLMCIWFFICPCRPLYDKIKGWQYEPLMDVETMVKKIPWLLLLLFGGGMALAEACRKSGLSLYLGNQMTVLQGMPHWLLITALCFVLSLFTEFTSNIAVMSISMPIMAQLALVLKLNPMQLMIPATMACTYAFMLPVATPPNAIVFSYGHLRVMDMVKTGFVLNIMAVLLTSIVSNTWGYTIFKYQNIPPEMMAVYNGSITSHNGTGSILDLSNTNDTLLL